MTAIRGGASILLGFLLLPLLMRGGQSVMFALLPEMLDAAMGGAAPTAYFVANLALNAGAGLLCACVTAKLAPDPKLMWVLLLAFVVFLGGLVIGVQNIGGTVPTWYLLGLPLVSGVSIAAGGWGYLLRSGDRTGAVSGGQPRAKEAS